MNFFHWEGPSSTPWVLPNFLHHHHARPILLRPLLNSHTFRALQWVLAAQHAARARAWHRCSGHCCRVLLLRQYLTASTLLQEPIEPQPGSRCRARQAP